MPTRYTELECNSAGHWEIRKQKGNSETSDVLTNSITRARSIVAPFVDAPLIRVGTPFSNRAIIVSMVGTSVTLISTAYVVFQSTRLFAPQHTCQFAMHWLWQCTGEVNLLVETPILASFFGFQENGDHRVLT